MKRRKNGEGSPRLRANGYYEIRVTLADGKRKSVYGKTQDEALRKKHELEHADDHGLPILDERQTVGQYLTSWYEMVKTQVKASTLRPYRNDIELRLIPYLGKTPLTKLTAQQVQLLYSRLIDTGTHPKTVYDCHGVLHQALDDAVKHGVLLRNVTDMVTPPRVPSPGMYVFSLEEIRRFLDQVHGDRWESLYILAFATGMREGELLGLRWQDIDSPNRTLHVRMAVTETDDNRFILAEPKTVYSRRAIALPEQATQALLDHWKRQIAESEQMGEHWHNEQNLVFPNGFGTIMIPHNIAKRSFKRHLDAIGMSRDVRFHDIRHTHATQLIILGVNIKVVSERLGHADVTTTMRTYAHVLPHMQQAAADASVTLIGSYEPGKIDTQVALLG